jgi:hypothetical protein
MLTAPHNFEADKADEDTQQQLQNLQCDSILKKNFLTLS